MADKYLNLQGLAEVAEYVNQKLKIVTEMPVNPSLSDIVLYNGATTANYKQGSIYLYTTIETYYKIGDPVYSDAEGTDSGFTIEAYDEINDQVTINSLIYDRDSTGDVSINKWTSKGSTSVILNGEDVTGNEANFYAPTAAGEKGQVLISNGVNISPTWASFAGYSPSLLDNSLVFTYGVIPEIEGNPILFDLDF